jgi:ParB family chromosome partitioning protein
MAAKRKQASTGKKTPRKKVARKRGRLAPRKELRGPAADEMALEVDSPALGTLAREVAEAGGAALGGYRDPLAGAAVLLAALPVSAIEPTPFQRDLSPTHAERLARRIEDTGVFLDPLIVVRGDGGFWTPNGRHRLAAAKRLGLRQVTALVSPDERLAFKILALNTEKAHNLRDRSLEVIRMARRLAELRPRAKESEFTAEFEAPELLTLGLVYERNGRFGGGAYSPFLKKVDRFGDRALPASLRERASWAARIEAIEAQVKRIVAELERRGFKSPYLRTYVVARINPVRFHKVKRGETKPPMPIGEALIRMAAAARKLDLDRVRPGDLALVAAVASSED